MEEYGKGLHELNDKQKREQTAKAFAQHLFSDMLLEASYYCEELGKRLSVALIHNPTPISESYFVKFLRASVK